MKRKLLVLCFGLFLVSGVCLASDDSKSTTSNSDCKSASLNLGVAKVSVSTCKTKNDDGTVTTTTKACSSTGLSVAGTGSSTEKCHTIKSTKSNAEVKK